jgi:hypothetical protein
MVGMGRSKDLGQTGPDDAGDALTKTTVRVSGEQMPTISIKSQHHTQYVFTCGSTTGLYC